MSSLSQQKTKRPVDDAPTAKEEESSRTIPEIIEIAADGDVVLDISHQDQGQKFRVKTALLKSHSKYFAKLLEPSRFEEGNLVEAANRLLKIKYTHGEIIPAAELPVIVVRDLGRISAVKSITPLCTDFFNIVHGKQPPSQTLPVINLANLAVVADRFFATPIVKSYIRRSKTLINIDHRTTPKIQEGLTEDKTRQRLLIGLLFDHADWVERYSTRIIVRGWTDPSVEITDPLWFDLPLRIEDELSHRRKDILDTINSVQTSFLAAYSSRERQCRMCYDNSAQCDSFQLGEMIKFFQAIGTLRLQGVIVEAEEPAATYEGDLTVLLGEMRKVREYQIDQHHKHCGLRTRLMPIVDHLSHSLKGTGICLQCWTDARQTYSWVDSKKPWFWRRQSCASWQSGDHTACHEYIRGMFTSTSRDWQ